MGSAALVRWEFAAPLEPARAGSRRPIHPSEDQLRLSLAGFLLAASICSWVVTFYAAAMLTLTYRLATQTPVPNQEHRIISPGDPRRYAMPS